MTSAVPNSSPLDTVKRFLACVRTKDLETMRKMAHPNATACLIRENKPNFKSLAEAIDALGHAEQTFEETLWDEIEHADGDYATVWTKFRIERDGEASYLFACSVRTILLIRCVAAAVGFKLVLVLEKP